MKVSLLFKLTAAFLALAAYQLIFAALNSTSIRKVDGAVQGIAQTITPSIQALADVRVNALRMLEEAYSGLTASAPGPLSNPALAAEELAESEEAARQTKESLEFYIQLEDPGQQPRTETKELSALAEEFAAVRRRILALASKFDPKEYFEIRKVTESLEERLVRATDIAIEMEVLDTRAQVDIAAIETRTLQRLNRVLSFSIILLAVLTGLILSYFLTRPILKLREAAGRAGQGDLSVRIKPHGNDEIADLSRSFNSMMEKLSQSTVSRELLENILESMHDCLVAVDGGNLIVHANHAFASLYGASASRIIGTDLAKVVKVDLAVHASNAESTLSTAAGEEVPVALSLSEASVGSPPRPGRIIIVRDLREQHRLQLEQHRYHERINRAERLASLGTLGAIVAHKLNQPLTSIRLFLQQALKEIKTVNAPPSVTESISDSLSEIEKASGTVREVLETTRRPDDSSSSAPITVNEIVKRTLMALAMEARRAGLKISVQGAESVPALTMIQLELEEIFYILIRNAIQASSPERPCELNVVCRSENGLVIFEFDDTCGGIPPHLQQNLFDTFFSTKSPTEGSGLGLNILKQIISKYGGSIAHADNNRNGSTFTVKLPQA